MKFTHVTLGGTWDHFHLGHQAMIDRAFAEGEVVWIGITTQKYLSNLPPSIAKKIGPLEPYKKREFYLKTYLTQKGWIGRAKLVPIDDKFGTTLNDENLEAIVVSPETELAATEINLLRAQKNFPALEVILVSWVLARDGEPIHSTRIRAGEIDREGNLYRLPSDWGVRRLPNNLREKLKKPLGRLIKGSLDDPNRAIQAFIKQYLTKDKQLLKAHANLTSDAIETAANYELRTANYPNLISVGDAVTTSLVKNGITPDISIIDLKIERKQVYKKIEELCFRNIKVYKKAMNEAGTLNYDSYLSLLELIKSEATPSVLQIEGEEDLLTLFALFLAPLNSLIVYGQPDEGIVVVEVNEEAKKTIMDLLLLL